VKRALCAAALLCAAAARADDGRYQDYPVGSRALALGGAFVAISEDPSGLYYNPAGVCDSHRLNVSVSASLYGIEKQSQGAIQIDSGSFTLATLNVIPGEAGILKGFGPLDARGTKFALGFDVSVPSFRSYGTDVSEPVGPETRQLHSRVLDRTFVLAAGFGMRIDERWNAGFALHYRLRLFSQTEDQLLTGGGGVGVYHAAASFQSGSLVAVLGTKLRLDKWLLGASVGLPSLPINSSGVVNVQDVTSINGQTTVTVLNEADRVRTSTPEPLVARAGIAYVEPRTWTLTSQLTLHAPVSYDRFDVPEPAASRLRIQDHVDRRAVVNFNAGAEYLFADGYSIAGGFFTDLSGAQPLQTDAATGVLLPASSRLPNVNLYGGTFTLGVIGLHSISRLGMSLSYGAGEDAVLDQSNGLSTQYDRVSVHQLFLYFFLASTFRY
jgi:long-chain fatty acid transport protein